MVQYSLYKVLIMLRHLELVVDSVERLCVPCVLWSWRSASSIPMLWTKHLHCSFLNHFSTTELQVLYSCVYMLYIIITDMAWRRDLLGYPGTAFCWMRGPRRLFWIGDWWIYHVDMFRNSEEGQLRPFFPCIWTKHTTTDTPIIQLFSLKYWLLESHKKIFAWEHIY